MTTEKESPKINPPLERFDITQESQADWRTSHAAAERHFSDAKRLYTEKRGEEAKAKFAEAALEEERAYYVLLESNPSQLDLQFSFARNVVIFDIRAGIYEKADEFAGGVLIRIDQQRFPVHFQTITDLKSLAKKHMAAQYS